jgi:hypothetical protein
MNRWVELKACLVRKWRAPRYEPTFWFYLVGAVFLAGGCGVWVSIGQQIQAVNTPDASWNWRPIIAALYTYFPALAAASAFDLLLLNQERYIRALSFLAVIVVVALAALAVTIPAGILAVGVCLLGYALAFSLWFLANAENPNLREPPALGTATGEDQPRSIAGTLNGFDQPAA